ncbi:hypothetical protein HH212_00010 [Massilia forsythiae]|uniref:Uncharacterized protein n=1 Tax=Massilia forsythiae TaxID=2728020 RepID=A0A7Z2VSU1_9BURK|nr:hypothetical protein [Massilia forsythiae]QJD98621.1 hypothetical protein HH212_00010 [Massilia forsythiae]
MTVRTIPNTTAAIYQAAKLIIAIGAQTREQLFMAVDFGDKRAQRAKIQNAFEMGWLYEAPAGKIDVTESTRKHFADQHPKEKYVGQVAPPAWRPNLMTGTLNPKYHTNSRGPRDDAPEWSRRETPNFRRA